MTTLTEGEPLHARPQRLPSGERVATRGDAEVLYPPKAVRVFVFGAVIVAFFAIVAVAAGLHSNDVADTIGGSIACLLFAGFGGFLMAANTEGVFRRHPLVRMDITGIECARGHVSWNDVEEVARVDRPHPQGGYERFVCFGLRAQTSVRPAEHRDYYDPRWQLGSRLDENQLEIPLGGLQRESFLRRVSDFYVGPIEGLPVAT
jgi:hypothetical protein